MNQATGIDSVNKDETGRFMREELPLASGPPQIAKEVYGKEYLITRGSNLSEANVGFGSLVMEGERSNLTTGPNRYAGSL